MALVGTITCSTVLAACSADAAPSLTVKVHTSDSAEQVGAVLRQPLSTVTWTGGRRLTFRYGESKPADWTGRTLLGGSPPDSVAARAAQQSGAMSDALSLYAIGPASNGDPWGGVSVETVQFSSPSRANQFSRKVQSRVKGVSAEGIVDGQELNTSVSNGSQCGNVCYSTQINFPVANRVVTIEMSCASSCEPLASQLAAALRTSLD